MTQQTSEAPRKKGNEENKGAPSPKVDPTATPADIESVETVHKPTPRIEVKKNDVSGENHGQTKKTTPAKEPLSPKSATPSASVIEKSVQDGVSRVLKKENGMNKGNTAATSHVSLPDIASNIDDAISINEVLPQETEVVKR